MMDAPFCERDRDLLMTAVEAHCGRCGRPPAEALDDILHHVLGVTVVFKPLAGCLALTNYASRCIYLNSRMTDLVRPNTYLPGLILSTKAHELAHLRLPHHYARFMAACQTKTPLDADTYATFEEEANFYSGCFLVPTAALCAAPALTELRLAAGQSSEALWIIVRRLARSFHVTGSFMARRLVYIGVLDKDGQELRVTRPL